MQDTKEVVDELRILAEKKGLKLSYICNKNHVKVMANEGLLKEVLINLIGNSIKFTEEGKITIEHSKKDGVVIHISQKLGPWRMITPKWGAKHTIEMRDERSRELGIKIGSQLSISGVFK